MKIKKIQDSYKMDVQGQQLNEECLYDCAHWKNNTASSPTGCEITLDKEITHLW